MKNSIKKLSLFLFIFNLALSNYHNKETDHLDLKLHRKIIMEDAELRYLDKLYSKMADLLDYSSDSKIEIYLSLDEISKKNVNVDTGKASSEYPILVNIKQESEFSKYADYIYFIICRKIAIHICKTKMKNQMKFLRFIDNIYPVSGKAVSFVYPGWIFEAIADFVCSCVFTNGIKDNLIKRSNMISSSIDSKLLDNISTILSERVENKNDIFLNLLLFISDRNGRDDSLKFIYDILSNPKGIGMFASNGTMPLIDKLFPGIENDWADHLKYMKRLDDPSDYINYFYNKTEKSKSRYTLSKRVDIKEDRFAYDIKKDGKIFAKDVSPRIFTKGDDIYYIVTRGHRDKIYKDGIKILGLDYPVRLVDIYEYDGKLYGTAISEGKNYILNIDEKLIIYEGLNLVKRDNILIFSKGSSIYSYNIDEDILSLVSLGEPGVDIDKITLDGNNIVSSNMKNFKLTFTDLNNVIKNIYFIQKHVDYSKYSSYGKHKPSKPDYVHRMNSYLENYFDVNGMKLSVRLGVNVIKGLISNIKILDVSIFYPGYFGEEFKENSLRIILNIPFRLYHSYTASIYSEINTFKIFSDKTRDYLKLGLKLVAPDRPFKHNEDSVVDISLSMDLKSRSIYSTDICLDSLIYFKAHFGSEVEKLFMPGFSNISFMNAVKDYIVMGVRYDFDFPTFLEIQRNRFAITNLDFGIFSYAAIDLNSNSKLTACFGPKFEIDLQIRNIDLYIDLCYAIKYDDKFTYDNYGIEFKISFD
jgi:hypothetical protein